MRGVLVLAVLVCSAPASADRPHTLWVPMQMDPATVPTLINSHTIYLNRCAAGCKVTPGATDSRTDHSDIVQAPGTLTAFSYGDGKWNEVVSCVKGVMSRFNLTVTDVDPGTVPHFEIMIAGNPGQVGLPNTVGGIADYPCTAIGQCAQYVPNALVFDFSDVWGPNTTDICGTAAQEVAHAWLLDHSTASNDPMTYNSYATPLNYKDGAQCGSDCVGCGGTCTAFMVSCTGSGLNGTHVCTENGNQTQDEVQTILKLFGAAGVKAPNVAIANPKSGAGVQAGFGIDVTCDSPDGVQEVDISVDGLGLAQLTAPAFHTSAPVNIKDGFHHVEALCGTKAQAVATAQADVISGPACATNGDCMASFLCYQTVCIAGPMATGGVGAPCTSDTDCSSGSCGNDGHQQLCVIPCDLSNDQCPAGFGCIPNGAGGACWLGADKGGGGCCDSGRNSSSGALFAGLGFAALLVTRRRRTT